MATRLPDLASFIAAPSPAGPEPRTTASYFTNVPLTTSFLRGIQRSLSKYIFNLGSIMTYILTFLDI